MDKEALEKIDSDLFDTFNPEDELWAVGAYRITISSGVSLTPSGTDNTVDADYVF